MSSSSALAFSEPRDYRGVFVYNQYHALNAWYAQALQGHITGLRLKTLRIGFQPQHILGLPLKRRSFFRLFFLATRKRVVILFHAYLVAHDIFLQLIPHIFRYFSFVPSYRIHVIAPAPEMSVSVLVFQVCVSVKDHQCALSFQISHELCYAYIRRYLHKHMYVIRACIRFKYFYFLCIT